MKNKKLDKRVILFAKDKFGLEEVIIFLRNNFADLDVFKGKVGNKFPKAAYNNKYNICVSYMSPWIIPEKLLRLVSEFSINFHPGTSDYRGIGCTNFALYHKEKEYGVTAHLMCAKVDSGRIINVRRFPILSSDTLVTLTQKCYRSILKQFYDVFGFYLKNSRLPASTEKWGKKLYTRRELNNLCKIEVGMPFEEITRRIKATDFPNMPKAYLDVCGCRFEYKQKIKNE